MSAGGAEAVAATAAVGALVRTVTSKHADCFLKRLFTCCCNGEDENDGSYNYDNVTSEYTINCCGTVVQERTDDFNLNRNTSNAKAQSKDVYLQAGKFKRRTTSFDELERDV